MRHLIVISALYFFTGTFQVAGQHKITLLTGKEILANKTKNDSVYLYYTVRKKEKERLKHVQRDMVFSVLHENGEEDIFYSTDSLIGNDYSITQMRNYIAGEKDAKSTYQPKPLLKLGAVVVGIGSAYLGHFWGPLPISAYAVAVSSTTPAIDKEGFLNKSSLDNEDFIQGYAKTARGKKIKAALIWGAAGFASGFITFTTILSNFKK